MPSSRLTVLVRCDRSPEVGAGHLTRCRALGHALTRHGVHVRFVLGEDARPWVPELVADGFGADLVPASPGTERLPLVDLQETLTVADEYGAAGIVVDHYRAGTAYVRGLAGAGLVVGVVDDLADRDLGAAAWILNQSLGAGPADYPAGRRLALGPGFALLRPQFAPVRAGLERRFADGDDRVLVTFGGGETAALAAEALASLESVGRRLQVRVVLGSSGPVPLELQRAVGASRHAVELLGAVEGMARAMAWADVSVNATGSTCWELACLGVPMVAAALSPDQEPNAAALAEAGVAVLASPADAGPRVEALLADPARRTAMSHLGLSLVDGLGAGRAAASLLLTIAALTEAVDAAA